MYAAAFLSLAAVLAIEAVWLRGVGWLLMWPAISFGLVGSAYAGLGPAVFGKRSDGSRRFWATLLLTPYLALQYGVWHLVRFLSSENHRDLLQSDLWIGRRPLPYELADQPRSLIVDLTCEFVASRPVRREHDYVCFPLLDVTAPDVTALVQFLDQLPRDRGCLIHCAQGHGRTGMVAASLLLVRGIASTADEAQAMIRAARPGVRLKAAQFRAVQGVEELLRQRSAL
jgi:protein-tyrosine phosphatase